MHQPAATAALPTPEDNQPAADARLRLVNTRAARAVFAVSACFAALGALLLAWAHTNGYERAGASVALWACFAAVSVGLCFIPPKMIERGGLALFLFAGVTALLINAVLRSQGVQTVGLIFLPMLLMLAALLTRPVWAVLLTLWAVAGLVTLYRGEASGLWVSAQPAPDPTVHFFGLALASVMAVFVGLLASMRFAQAARLSAHHEMRYRELFDRIPSAVVLHDNGRVLDANRAALDIVGETRRSAFIGRDVREFMTSDQARSQFDDRLEELRGGGVGDALPVVDLEVRRTSGQVMQVRATEAILRPTASGAALNLLAGHSPLERPLYLSFMLDDTRRFAAQAETARVRALLEAVLSHSPYVFALSRRADGRLVQFNQAFETLVGHSRETLLSHTVNELGIWARQEDRERFFASLADPAAVTAEHLLRLMRADGQPRLIKGVGSLLTFDGEPYVLLVGRDVTDSRRRQAEQDAVLENAPVGVATTQAGVTLSANPRMHEIFGWPPGRMIGMHTHELWPDRVRHDRVEAQVLQDIRDNGRTRFEETFHLRDRQLTVRMSGRLLPDDGSGVPTIVWITEDITQDRQTERALQEAAKAASAASQAKSAFLANMSHELRTPLNGILGLLDMALESDAPPAEQRHQVELARESSRVLADLLNDVLDLSKIEAGRLEIEAAPFDLRSLLESIKTVHEVLAESRGLHLRFDVSLGAEGPAWVHGDAVRVRQILHNFLSNALKFTAQGEIQVVVHRLQGDQAQLVRLEVQDSGPGIPPGVQKRLFQAFEQGDASAARRQGGTGLGLAICRELATIMGGAVGVESEEGQGSRFWAELPLRPLQAPPLAGAAPAAEIRLEGLRVLVAEDNPVNMLITTTMLERAGAQVEGVTDGQSALHAVLKADAAQNPYTLLLMDIQMPGLDGLQATQALRLTHASERLPIIALTAGALQTERDAALQAGMNDFVTKPVDRLSLLTCVERHARRPRSADLAALA